MTETVAPDYHQMWAELGLDLPTHDSFCRRSAACTATRT